MKSELHRHFSGATSPGTVYRIFLEQGVDISKQEVEKIMHGDSNNYTFDGFLNRFKIFDKIKWTKDVVRQVASQVVWDIAAERINYFEMKISIDRYVEHLRIPPEEVIQLFYSALADEVEKWDIQFGIILALKYEADKEKQTRWSKIIEDPDTARLVVGVDLVGQEEAFDVDFYIPIFKEWKEAGKGLEAHVGESQTAQNVVDAVTKLHVNRIAHGIKIVDYPEIMKLVIDKNVCLDVALTSNIQTGIVKTIAEHPVKRLLDAGVQITIGTDDPTILQTTLDNEYQLLQSSFNVSEKRLFDIMENSIKYAFTDGSACFLL